MSPASVEVRLQRAESEIEKLRTELAEARTARDDLLDILGHELRNPLSPIVSAIELAKLRGPGVLSRELDIIERNVQHLRMLVDELLDISCVMSGDVVLEATSVRLVAAIDDAVAATAHLREHPVVVDVAPELRVLADRARLVQVLTHVLGSTEGPRTLRAVADGDVAVIQVEGGGRSLRGGRGLALVLVEKMVALHRGQVCTTADRLTVNWPLARRDTVVVSPRPSPRRRRRVLIVDDNADAANTLADMLRLMGHEVLVAHDGAQALLSAESARPQIALLDIGMPIMDGYELAQRMRKLPSFEKVALVALTGYGSERERERAFGAGFDRHLVKPIDPDQLSRLLDDDP